MITTLDQQSLIAISGDLFDRMQETRSGPQLRDWCRQVGLLPIGEDFADRRVRGGPLSVQAARAFIMAYFAGARLDSKNFDSEDTTPDLLSSGSEAADWERLKVEKPDLWIDQGLDLVGKAYAKLIAAQKAAFAKKVKTPVDFPDKASNLALMTAWAFVAGVLRNNASRLKRHFRLSETAGRDPLNAAALAKGKHKTDKESYRGLGYRTDAKERGRFAELFFLQAEDGFGITPTAIDLAIKKYYAKQANLEVKKAAEKSKSKVSLGGD